MSKLCSNYIENSQCIKDPQVSFLIVSASNSKFKNKGPKSYQHGTFIYEVFFP